MAAPRDPADLQRFMAELIGHGVLAPDDSVLAIQRYVNESIADMLALSVPPSIAIDHAVPGSDRTVIMEFPKPGSDPRIAAEKLLRTVLPEDLCISLSATGECVVTAKSGFIYTIKKNQKTHCKKTDGTVHSCCIGLEDTAAPDTDRIVAEYLLIINDEAQYLKTANLTQIGGRRVAWTDGVPRLRMRDYIGDTVTVRVPPEYGGLDHFRRQYMGNWEDGWTPRPDPRAPHTHLQVVCNELFRLVFDCEHLRRPFPEVAIDEARQFRSERFTVELHENVMGLDALAIDEFRERFLRPAAMQLQAQLAPDRVNLIAFRRLTRDAPYEFAECRYEGKSLGLYRAFDVQRNEFRMRGRVDVILAG